MLDYSRKGYQTTLAFYLMVYSGMVLLGVNDLERVVRISSVELLLQLLQFASFWSLFCFWNLVLFSQFDLLN